MTCHGSRDDYIASVRDVVEACRFTTERVEAYLEELRRDSAPAAAASRESWRTMAEAITRLASSETRAHEVFERAFAHHRTSHVADSVDPG
jgi:hypothetical protein